ncbi:MAG: hypothetical protein ACP5M9_01995 [Candidatus Micrarchaeia archaeon]
MKVFVIGDEKTLEDALDFFSDLGMTVVGKVINPNDVSGITTAINDSFTKGYGIVVAYVKDTIGASIFLNRDKRIKAAVCNTELDVALAEKNNVNVFLINNDVDVSIGIFKAMKKNKNNAKDQLEERKSEKHIASKSAVESTEYFVKLNKSGEQKKAIGDEPLQEEREPKESKGKGFFKNIKDSLGIVDE